MNGFARIPAGFGQRGGGIVLKRNAELTMGLTMGRWEDARAEELHNLRLALATFALQLDAFEMRATGALPAAGREASMAVTRSNRPRDTEGGK